MKFKYTTLYVEDVEQTLKFYKAAFALERGMLHESGDYGELKTGDTVLSFSALKLIDELGKNPSRPDAKSPSFEIAFETDDVAAALNRAVEAGAIKTQDVEEMPWGQTTAYVTDLNGFSVELCTAIQG